MTWNLPKWVLCLIFSLVGSNIYGQQTVRILDAQTNQPIDQAIIYFENITTTTDSTGSFSIPSDVTSIEISRIGYTAGTFQIIDNSPIIYLEPNILYNEILVSAYPVNKNEWETPASFTTISRKELEINNQLDYSQVLNNTTGVYMHAGTLGTNRITIRGIGARTPFGTNKIKAYYGEIPLTAGDGETSLEDNDLSFLGNMEVIKGPAATSYGAGLAGLIKLNPVQYNRSFVSLGYGTGSFGLNRLSSKANVLLSNASVGISYTNIHSDGYRENNQYDRDNFIANYQSTFGKTEVLALATYTDVIGFIPSSINATQFEEDPSAAAGNWGGVRGFEDYDKGLFGVSLSHQINTTLQVSGSVFNSFRSNYELRPFGILTEKSNVIGTRVNHTANFKVLSYSLGAEYYTESYEATTLDQDNRQPTELTSFNQEKRRVANIYLDINYLLSDKLELETGLNFNQTKYRLTDLFLTDSVDQSGKYKFDAILSPKLALKYLPKNNLQFYGLVSHGFSAPSVEETLTPDGLINTDIQPEQGYNIELGSKGLIQTISTKYTFAIYSMQIQDLLVAERVGQDQFVGLNAGKTNHNGIEVSLEHQLDIGAIQILPYANLTISDYEFESFTNLDDDFGGNKLPGVPDYVANLGLNVNTQFGLSAGFVMRSAGEMFLRDDNIETVDSYAILNTKVSYQKSLGSFEFVLNGGINNIGDKRYASMILVNANSFGGAPPRYYYPGLPRNFFFNINLSYNFRKD